MDLENAFRLLAKVHTKDDEKVGFQVLMGATPFEFEDSDYCQAWATVRSYLGLRTDPSQYPRSE
jgi:hypothetical protein